MAETDLVDQFSAGRGAIAQGDDAWIRELAGETTTPGKPSAAAPAADGKQPAAPEMDDDTNVPFGLRVQNALGAIGRSLAAVPAEIGKQSKEALDRLGGDVAGSDEFKQRSNALGPGLPGAAVTIGLDVLDYVLSPIAGAATQVLGEPLEKLTGGRIQKEQAGKNVKTVAGMFIGGAKPVPVSGLKTLDEQLAKHLDALPMGSAERAGVEQSRARIAEQLAKPVEAPPAVTLKGQEPGAKLVVNDGVRKQAEDYFSGKKGSNPIQASLEAISSDEALNASIIDVAKMIPKGKVKPDDVLAANAYALNMSVDDVLERLRPNVPNDEVMAAGAMLVNSGAEELQRFAAAAVREGTPEAWEAATRAFAMQNQVIRAWREGGTEWGRAGRVRQQAWEARSDFSKSIQQVVENVGPVNMEEALRKIAALEDPRKVSAFVSTLRWMKSREGLLYGWYNVLLSNPKSIGRQLLSNVAVGLWEVPVRALAARTGSGAVKVGEATALLQGYSEAFGDALIAAGKAARAGRSQFEPSYSTMDGLTRTRLSDLVKGPQALSEGAPTSAAYELLRAAMPTSWNAAADDFGKVMFYRAEARALLYRDGMQKGLSGETLQQHIAANMNNMPEGIHYRALEASLRNSFQEPLTGIAEDLRGAVDKINIPIVGTDVEIPLGRMIAPFVKTPANITKYAYRNSPLPIVAPSRAFQEDLAAGGARRDLALARVGLATGTVMTLFAPIVASTITGGGPTDPQLQSAWRRAGNTPYSINFGGGSGPVSYRGVVDPFGLILGAVADSIETMKFASEQDNEDIGASLIFGVGNAMLSKTYMQGASDFLDALRNPQDEGANWLQRLETAVVSPAGVAGIAAATDPWLRAHYDFLDSVQARTPGLSSELPPLRNLWGDPIPQMDGFLPPLTGTGAARMLSPIAIGQPAENAQPIDKWVWDNRLVFPQAGEGRLGLSAPGQVQTYSGGNGVSVRLKLDPYQLDRLKVLAGNELKDPETKLGARDTLNALVEGKHPTSSLQNQWNKATPDLQALMVLRVWNKFRDAAKKQIAAEYPDISDAIGAGLDARAKELSGGGNAPAVAQPRF